MYYFKYKTSFIKEYLESKIKDINALSCDSRYRIHDDGTFEYWGRRHANFVKTYLERLSRESGVVGIRGFCNDIECLVEKEFDEPKQLTWLQLSDELLKFKHSNKPVCINIRDDIHPVRIESRLRECQWGRDDILYIHAISPMFNTQYDRVSANNVTVCELLKMFDDLYLNERDKEAILLLGYSQMSSVSCVIETDTCILIMNAWYNGIPVFTDFTNS